jgi:hypothetical protein
MGTTITDMTTNENQSHVRMAGGDARCTDSMAASPHYQDTRSDCIYGRIPVSVERSVTGIFRHNPQEKRKMKRDINWGILSIWAAIIVAIIFYLIFGPSK